MLKRGQFAGRLHARFVERVEIRPLRRRDDQVGGRSSGLDGGRLPERSARWYRRRAVSDGGIPMVAMTSSLMPQPLTSERRSTAMCGTCRPRSASVARLQGTG